MTVILLFFLESIAVHVFCVILMTIVLQMLVEMQKKSLFLLPTFLPCDRMMISGDDHVSGGDAAATCKTLGSPVTLCFISCRYECV